MTVRALSSGAEVATHCTFGRLFVVVRMLALLSVSSFVACDPSSSGGGGDAGLPDVIECEDDCTAVNDPME